MRKSTLYVIFWSVCLGFTVQAQASEPLACDVNGDGWVDKLDLSIISKSRGQQATYPDSRDVNGDGIISTTDVRACVFLCNLPSCAILK